MRIPAVDRSTITRLYSETFRKKGLPVKYYKRIGNTSDLYDDPDLMYADPIDTYVILAEHPSLNVIMPKSGQWTPEDPEVEPLTVYLLETSGVTVSKFDKLTISYETNTMDDIEEFMILTTRLATVLGFMWKCKIVPSRLSMQVPYDTTSEYKFTHKSVEPVSESADATDHSASIGDAPSESSNLSSIDDFYN